MIVDSSALVAIMRGESDAERYEDAILSNQGRLRLSAATFFEAAIVIDASRRLDASAAFSALISDCGIVIEPFTRQQAELARQAYQAYGKGSGHPARLNFGDCFAYALAKDKAEPLLFKGDDFARTDVQSAI